MAAKIVFWGVRVQNFAEKYSVALRSFLWQVRQYPTKISNNYKKISVLLLISYHVRVRGPFLTFKKQPWNILLWVPYLAVLLVFYFSLLQLIFYLRSIHVRLQLLHIFERKYFRTLRFYCVKSFYSIFGSFHAEVTALQKQNCFHF